MSPGRTVRLAVVSLGCPKNLVDTERALGEILSAGVMLVDDPARADWILINTCGFIADARQESRDAIAQAVRFRRRSRRLMVVVAGCLSERLGGKLNREIGPVDFVTGVLSRENARKIARKITGHDAHCDYAENDDRQRLRLTPRHVAYLRISEGCDNRCAYCAIPDIRGPLRSRPFENVIADAQELLADGAVELNVIAQDTTAYGMDMYGRPRLAELLRELARLNPRGWVRLLYAHPAHTGEDVVAVLAKGAPFAPYVDLPLQHVNDRILGLMGRRVTRARIEEIIQQLRARIPGVFIRTAFIVGFPSETRAEFDELLAFIRETKFERLGAFAYSPEEGTPAGAMSGQIPFEERVGRLDELMRVQAKIAFAANASLVGAKVPGIIDGMSGRDDRPLLGRTAGDAPDVDGTVFASGRAKPGDMVTMKIVGVDDYDLLAEVVR